MILVLWILSFKPDFSLSSFTFKRLFSSFPISATRAISPVYLRLLIFLLASLILTCNSSSQAFCMMYCTFKLNKQGDSIQPCQTPFWILNLSDVPCKVLPVASWPTYRFLRRQVRWSGVPTSLIIFQFVVIHTVKGFHVVNEAEVDVFLEFLCFLYDTMDVGNLISGSSDFSKPSLYIWKFLIQVLLKTSSKDFEHNPTSIGSECNCLVAWIFFITSLLWDWDEDWPFPVLWPLLSVPSLQTYWVQQFYSIIF